jgi:hypothetical protein
MSAQERLDTIEDLILHTAGTVRVFNVVNFRGTHPKVKAIEDLLGDTLQEVLELKKELGLTSNLSIVEEAHHE